MSIRIRIVDGVWVALCAAKTKAEPGDTYLDDYIHHPNGKIYSRFRI